MIFCYLLYAHSAQFASLFHVTFQQKSKTVYNSSYTRFLSNLCFHYTIDEPLSYRRGFNQQENQARFCKNVFSAMWITKSRSSESAFAKSI